MATVPDQPKTKGGSLNKAPMYPEERASFLVGMIFKWRPFGEHHSDGDLGALLKFRPKLEGK